MTCSREDSSIEKVKHSKSSLKRKSVHHASDDLIKTDDTDPDYSYRLSKSHVRSKAMKVVPNGNTGPQRRNLRDRNTSTSKSNDDFSNRNAKDQASRPMLASPAHRTSSRLSSKAQTDTYQMNSHSVRSSRQSSRSQNIDLNSSASYDHCTRRSPRKPSFSQYR